MNVSIQTVT